MPRMLTDPVLWTVSERRSARGQFGIRFTSQPWVGASKLLSCLSNHGPRA
jgi:hypothetical protein